MTPNAPRRRALISGLVSICAAGPARAAPAAIERAMAPSARLWARWQPHDPHASLVVDHAALTTTLAAIVRTRADGSTRVAYAAVTPAMRAGLDAYLAAVAAVAVARLARPEQFALWVNLYNALTLRVVLDALARGPVRSIRDIDLSHGLFSGGPWDAKLIAVDGEPVSLNDIEHRILRPIWRDPRVHYAVNCASVGCPDLQPMAFTGAGLGARLDAAATAYVNHPRGVTPTADGLVLSSIYNWFAEDFEPDGVIAHLRRFARPALTQALTGSAAIDSYRYDWSLNTV